MRTMSRITFHIEPMQAMKILAPLQINTKINDTLQVAKIYMDSPKYGLLTQQLKALDVDYNEYTEIVYSKKELETSELFYVIPNRYCGYPQPDSNGGYLEQSYDLASGCSRCANGFVQNRPLRILKPQMGNTDIVSLYWVYEFIITIKLKNVIEDEGLTGCEFWPVIDHNKNVVINGIYQLHITNIMPPMSEKTSFLKAPMVKECECGKKGYYIDEGKIYDQNSVDLIKDFNKTFEWLGAGESTWQLPLFSKQAYKVFNKHNIKGLRFEPIMIM